MASPESSQSRVERRRRWRLTADPPPEGWRRGTQWFREEDGTLDVLYTNAPSGVSPYADEYEHVFVNYSPVEQVRTVTEWVDADAA
jgi:hypothetical protein